MTVNSHLSEVLTFCFVFLLSCALQAQDCNSPETLCPLADFPNYTYEDGAPSDVGPGFCFGDAPNAVFYSFQTQDTDAFPFIDYTDSTATLVYQVDSCLADTSLGIAVFQASDLCDGSTFTDLVLCETDTQGSGQFNLASLQPSTTYFVMITGLTTSGPDPSQCSFSVGVSGPALEYDLDVDAFPEVNPGRADIFAGETVTLTAEGGLGTIQWSGPQLNSLTGPEVTADPEGVDITVTYTATVEVDGCIFTGQVSFVLLPPIIPYNTFTPNGDGFNDTWEIQNIDEWPNAQIFVYSRWGNRVFQSTNYENDWGGDDLPAATYYYVIELNPVDFNAEPITGSVTILR